MAALDLFTERNCTNSMAQYFSGLLLGASWAIYWHKIDSLQLPNGNLYPNYRLQAPTYLLNSGFAAAMDATQGMITLVQGLTELPRFATQPTADGRPSTYDRVQVPCFGVEVGPPVPLSAYESGSYLRWRVRALTIEGQARSYDEMVMFSDLLARWFDDDLPITVHDHDGTEPDDFIRVTRAQVTRDVIENEGQQNQFHIELNARLEYVA